MHQQAFRSMSDAALQGLIRTYASEQVQPSSPFGANPMAASNADGAQLELARRAQMAPPTKTWGELVCRSPVGRFTERQFWQVFTQCVVEAEQHGEPVTEAERRALWAMCERGDVRFRAAPELLRAAGISWNAKDPPPDRRRASSGV